MTIVTEALVVNRNATSFSINVQPILLTALTNEEVLIQVHYSSINYKDCLACSEEGKIINQYPHIPGIDLAGIVIESRSDKFNIGDKVIATGYEIGVSQFGGFSKHAKVKAEYVLKLPKTLSLKEAMIFGTAGFTAALSILQLEHNGLERNGKKVLVTGASGGVGSHAVAILAKLGYEVIASSRKTTTHDYLKYIGAQQIIPSDDLIGDKIKALDVQQFDGAIDVVAGTSLAAILSKLKYGASVAVSGLTSGTQIETTIFPFILRGIKILGIDSVYCPQPFRNYVWDQLATTFKHEQLERIISEEISLAEVPAKINQLLHGEMIGRYIVNLRA